MFLSPYLWPFPRSYPKPLFLFYSLRHYHFIYYIVFCRTFYTPGYQLYFSRRKKNCPKTPNVSFLYISSITSTWIPLTYCCIPCNLVTRSSGMLFFFYKKIQYEAMVISPKALSEIRLLVRLSIVCLVCISETALTGLIIKVCFWRFFARFHD